MSIPTEYLLFSVILVLSRANICDQAFFQPRDMNAYCLDVKLVYNSSLPHQWFHTMNNIGKTTFLAKSERKKIKKVTQF